MLQVEKVVAQAAQHLLHGVGIAVVQSGIGRNAGTNLVQVAIARVVLHNLVDVELALGPGAYEGHFADKHVPQLGQFVQVMVAQKLAHLGEALVFFARIQGRTVLLGIQLHAAELVDVERTTETPDAFLLEYGRATVFALHGNVAYQEKGRKHNHGHQGREAVEETLHVALEAVHTVANEMIVI